MKQKSKNTLSDLIDLALTFFKIGAFTFGGGYAMISIIEREAVTKKKWIESEEMLNVIAIAESTPGPIALNMATYLGAKVAGFVGAFIASVSVLLPALIIITLISAFLTPFFDNQYLRYAFLGMRAGVSALVLNAVINLGGFLKKEKRPAVFAILFISLVFSILSAFNILGFDNIFIIVGAILIGLFYTFIQDKYKKNNKLNSTKDKGNKL
ncbi:MAG: chromate transporter [Candidatus Neomarinimicrobiota bacterium]